MNKDELEFKNVYNHFHQKIVRHISRLTDGQDAEDLTQEVFTKIARALKTFRGESQLSTWIYRIATNTALDSFRNRSYRQMSGDGLLEYAITASAMQTGDGNVWLEEKTSLVEAMFDKKETNECVRNFIKNLPEDYRAVAVLHELEELKNNEIADILGITLNTVKIRLHRARVKIKQALEAYCSFYRNDQNELTCERKNIFKGFQKIR